MTTLVWIPVISLVVAVSIATFIYRRYRRTTEPRLITCPETGKREAVKVDPVHRFSHAITGAPDMRLCDCSRWPERSDCDQPCLQQIVDAPDGCRVRTVLDAFYTGGTCASCERTIEKVDWAQHTPGILTPDGTVSVWNAFATEKLEELLERSRPVCWDCLQVAQVYQEHPELVTERPHRNWEAQG